MPSDRRARDRDTAENADPDRGVDRNRAWCGHCGHGVDKTLSTLFFFDNVWLFWCGHSGQDYFYRSTCREKIKNGKGERKQKRVRRPLRQNLVHTERNDRSAMKLQAISVDITTFSFVHNRVHTAVFLGSREASPPRPAWPRDVSTPSQSVLSTPWTGGSGVSGGRADDGPVRGVPGGSAHADGPVRGEGHAPGLADEKIHGASDPLVHAAGVRFVVDGHVCAVSERLAPGRPVHVVGERLAPDRPEPNVPHHACRRRRPSRVDL